MRVKCVETTSPFEVFKVGGWYYFKKGVENIYEMKNNIETFAIKAFQEEYSSDIDSGKNLLTQKIVIKYIYNFFGLEGFTY